MINVSIFFYIDMKLLFFYPHLPMQDIIAKFNDT